MFLLKDTTQWCRWGSNPRPLGLESSTLPMSHRAPLKQMRRLIRSRLIWISTVFKCFGRWESLFWKAGFSSNCQAWNFITEISILVWGHYFFGQDFHCLLIIKYCSVAFSSLLRICWTSVLWKALTPIETCHMSGSRGEWRQGFWTASKIRNAVSCYTEGLSKRPPSLETVVISISVFKKPFEPVHEISNNVVCATSKVSDQPAHTRSLIRAFASPLSILWLLCYWLNIIWSFLA